MITVYILELSNHTFYTGLTGNLNSRLAQHNSGQSKSTRNFLPAKIIHTEEFLTRQQARKKEVQIKKSGAKRYLSRKKFR